MVQKRKGGASLVILSGAVIRSYIRRKQLVVSPISKETVQCNGLDLSLGHEVARLRPCSSILDTRCHTIPEEYYTKEKAPSFVIHPHECILTCTKEKLGLPDDIVGFVNLRSTYARLGLLSPCGFIEAGFNGQLTVEMTGGHFPVRIHTGERIFHVVFMQLSNRSRSTYKGRYQNQVGVTLPILDGQKRC